MKRLNRVTGAAIAGLSLLGGLVGVISAQAGPASASLSLLTTTTTVSANPQTITDQSQATVLTATVDLELVHGLLITPSGAVTFKAVNGDTTENLGSGTLSSCLLGITGIPGINAKCTASVSTSNLTLDGTWTVTATYSGATDLVAGASKGTTTVLVIPGDSETCAPSDSCDITTYNGDGNASVEVYMYNSSNSDQSVYAGFGYPVMGTCAGGNTATDGSFSTNALSDSTGGLPKHIYYTLYGSLADAANAAVGDSSQYDFCYAAQTSFTTANGTPAVYNPVNNDFEGDLPYCNEIDDGAVVTNPPCYEIVNQSETAFGIEIFTPAGTNDPGTGRH